MASETSLEHGGKRKELSRLCSSSLFVFSVLMYQCNWGVVFSPALFRGATVQQLLRSFLWLYSIDIFLLFHYYYHIFWSWVEIRSMRWASVWSVFVWCYSELLNHSKQDSSDKTRPWGALQCSLSSKNAFQEKLKSCLLQLVSSPGLKLSVALVFVCACVCIACVCVCAPRVRFLCLMLSLHRRVFEFSLTVWWVSICR